MALDNRYFTEPGPFNPNGNYRSNRLFKFDMTAEGDGARLERLADGRAVVRAFTDLKRHNLNDEELKHFANERVAQGSLVGFAPASSFTIDPLPRPTDQFLTRKLWDAGSTDPYGHRGDLSTMTEAIFFHGGEGRASRDAFLGLPDHDQDCIIEFLKCLQIVDE
jgi:CxxC motif-containing protein (DUF1111 family)